MISRRRSAYSYKVFLYWLFTGILFTLLFAGLPFKSTSNGIAAVLASNPASISSAIPSTNSIPTTIWHEAPLPDFNAITFASLPPIQESGSFAASPDVISQLGYNPSRTWVAGQTPDKYMTLGDFGSFKLEQFDLQSIASMVGLDLSALNLNDFGLMRSQTLASLVKAIPDLKAFPIAQVKPINDLLAAKIPDLDPNQTIGKLLEQSPLSGGIGLKDLTKTYKLDSIPGVDSAALGFFKDWQSASIAEIPGLSQLPFSHFPAPPNPLGSVVQRIDIAFATPEQRVSSTQSISGSDVEGFNVGCDKNCAHVEFSDGTQWVSGKFQEVKGGKGILGKMNNGKEPTGRFLFGDAFKVVIGDISETQGTVSQSLYFHVCARSGFIDLGCTPYFIGPLPWLSSREGESMFLGLTNPLSSVGSTNRVSTPTNAEDKPKPSTFALHLNPPTSSTLNSSSADSSPVTPSSSATCIKQNGVVANALGIALSPDSNVDASLKSATLLDLSKVASTQIDKNTGKLFGEGDPSALVVRIAEMYWGGQAIAPNSTAINFQGQSLSALANDAASSYQNIVKTLGCN